MIVRGAMCGAPSSAQQVHAAIDGHLARAIALSRPRRRSYTTRSDSQCSDDRGACDRHTGLLPGSTHYIQYGTVTVAALAYYQAVHSVYNMARPSASHWPTTSR